MKPKEIFNNKALSFVRNLLLQINSNVLRVFNGNFSFVKLIQNLTNLNNSMFNECLQFPWDLHNCDLKMLKHH